MYPRCSFLLAAALSSAADAAVIHRCQLADGGIVYRDTVCATGETLLSQRAYEVAEPAPVPHAGAGAARAKPERKAHRESPRRAPPRDDDRIVAHECRFGEQRWVQAQACPARMQGEKQSVHETRLTRAEVCGALRDLSAAQSPGEGSARRADGMNRLRQRHGC